MADRHQAARFSSPVTFSWAIAGSVRILLATVWVGYSVRLRSRLSNTCWNDWLSLMDTLISGACLFASVGLLIRSAFENAEAVSENGEVLVQEAHPGREVGHAEDPGGKCLALMLKRGLGILSQ